MIPWWCPLTYMSGTTFRLSSRPSYPSTCHSQQTLEFVPSFCTLELETDHGYRTNSPFTIMFMMKSLPRGNRMQSLATKAGGEITVWWTGCHKTLYPSVSVFTSFPGTKLWTNPNVFSVWWTGVCKTSSIFLPWRQALNQLPCVFSVMSLSSVWWTGVCKALSIFLPWCKALN